MATHVRRDVNISCIHLEKTPHTFCDGLSHLRAELHCLFTLFYCFRLAMLLVSVNCAGVRLMNAQTPVKRFSSRIERWDIFAHFLSRDCGPNPPEKRKVKITSAAARLVTAY